MTHNADSTVYTDFAHAPSKVMATLAAIKEQNSGKHIIACLELHTYSSLSPNFLPQYKNTLNLADKAIVFYSKHASEIKRLETLKDHEIKSAFNRADLVVAKTKEDLETFFGFRLNNTIVVFMSSGNFDNLDIKKLSATIIN
ncbi:MAG: hypothetical protein HC896_14795 [Bacteroidales bacterium]|nr:hypothetical protein [Bacteroidales bacterium]